MVMGTRNTINADIGSDFGIEEYSNVWVNEEVTDITDHTGTIAEWTYADRTSVNFYIKYGAVGLSGGGSAGETAYATTDNNIFQYGRQISFSVGGCAYFTNTAYETTSNIAYGEVQLVDSSTNSQAIYKVSASNPDSTLAAGFAGGFAHFVLTLSEDGNTVNVRSGGHAVARYQQTDDTEGAGTATIIADGTDIDISGWTKPLKLKIIAKGQGGQPEGEGDIWISPIITNKTPYVIGSKRQVGKYTIT